MYTGLHTDMTLDLFVQIVHQKCISWHAHCAQSCSTRGQRYVVSEWSCSTLALSCNGYSIYSVLRLQVDFHRLSLNAPHRPMHFIKLASSCKLENFFSSKLSSYHKTKVECRDRQGCNQRLTQQLTCCYHT